jgi:hypothetical protein
MKYTRWLVWGGLLLLVGWLLFKGWRLYSLAQNFQEHRAMIEILAAGELGAGGMVEAADTLLAIRADTAALRDEVAIFMPLTPYLGWLPQVGPLMPAAPHLLEMADAGTETGAVLVTALRPALIASQERTPEEPLIPLLLRQLQAHPEAIAAAQESYGRVLAARDQIGETADWPYTAQQLLGQFDQIALLGVDGLTLAPHLAELAGGNGRRTYLIVAQNQEELRPTGGFISGAGLLEVEDGQLGTLTFSDAYTVDQWNSKPYDFPPAPLYEFMGSELFLFRDSNFWPDFPTSAEQMMTLYTYGTGTAVDGVIAFDQEFLRALVAGLGYVYIPELDLTLRPTNLDEQIRSAWGAGDGEGVEWIEERKSFMGPMANAIREKLETGLGNVDLVDFGVVMAQAIHEKHLQVYVREPQTAATLRQLGWDGQLRGQRGVDTLAVVDTNVGFNKANVLVETSIAYEVALGVEATAELTLTYTHTSPNASQPCDPTIPTYEQGLQYEVLLDRCYWNYVRLFAPAGTELRTADSHPAPAEMFLSNRAWAGVPWVEQEPTHGLTSIHNFLLLKRGETLTSGYSYRLPDNAVGQNGYVLQVFHQAGRKPTPLTISVEMPAGVVLETAVPAPSQVDGQRVIWNLTLNQDATFSLTWR